MKFFLNNEDNEDYEQELAIKQWLEQNGNPGFDFTSINRKGNARHIGDVGCFSLDQKISEENGGGTYADLVAGSDGRDLECGEDLGEDDNGMSAECCLEILLKSIGANKEALRWAMGLYKDGIRGSRLRLAGQEKI